MSGIEESPPGSREMAGGRLGLWIDQRRAYLVHLDRNGVSTVSCVESGVEPRRKPRGGQRAIGGASHQKPDARRRKQMLEYYQRLAAVVSDASEVWLIGPGRARKELLNQLEGSSGLSHLIVGTRSADQMTQRQLEAEVRELFGIEKKRRRPP